MKQEDAGTATREVVNRFYECLGAHDTAGIAALFAEEIDWCVPGHEGLASWLGRRQRPAQVAEVFETLFVSVEPLRVQIDAILVEGEVAVAFGEFASRMLATGRVYESPFAAHFTVRDGRIVRYRLLEDSYGLVVALTP